MLENSKNEDLLDFKPKVTLSKNIDNLLSDKRKNMLRKASTVGSQLEPVIQRLDIKDGSQIDNESKSQTSMSQSLSIVSSSNSKPNAPLIQIKNESIEKYESSDNNDSKRKLVKSNE